MASNYTVYENLYNYMNSLFSQIRSLSGDYTSYYDTSRTVTGTQSTGLSFADIFAGVQSRIEVPESMDAIFEEAARIYNVPAQLLKAVGKAESNFDASAVSSAGAQGVMQLMPSTAASLGVEDPFDARSNIMGGAQYISAKLAQYDGNIDLALAAYNAGSGNVEKYGGVPPFKETKNDIKKIKEYMGMDLDTGKTVSSSRTAYNKGTDSSSLAGERTSLVSGFSEEDARYLVELMRLQMQTRAVSLSASLGDVTDENDSLW